MFKISFYKIIYLGINIIHFYNFEIYIYIYLEFINNIYFIFIVIVKLIFS